MSSEAENIIDYNSRKSGKVLQLMHVINYVVTLSLMEFNKPHNALLSYFRNVFNFIFHSFIQKEFFFTVKYMHKIQ